jgi:hypothetical protein
MNAARHPRLRSFLNFVLWYLGCLFMLFGILAAGIVSLPTLNAVFVYSIIVGSLILVIMVARRCKVGFWAGVAAWVIGCAAMLLVIVIPTLILLYINNAKVAEVSDQFAFILFLFIGAALLLNRWLARRHRAKTENAASAAVFD